MTNDNNYCQHFLVKSWNHLRIHFEGLEMIYLRLVCLIHIAYLRGFSCYPNGAPDDSGTCSTLAPSHGSSARTSSSPYQIQVSATTITNSGSLTVTISGQPKFEGFILQARSSSTNSSVGTFVSSSSIAQTCQSSGGASVTHTDKSLKSSVVVTWNAPSTATDVVFVASVVQSYSTFWTMIRSSIVTSPNGNSASQSNNAASSSTTAKQSSSGSVNDVDISTCGKSKGCFVSSCTNDGVCDMVMTWSDAGSNVAFELSSIVSKQQSYLSVGYSTDTRMGDDSVTDCIYNSNNGKITIRMSYNNGHRNSPVSDQSSLVPGTMSGGYINNRIICRFSRPKLPPANGRKKRQSSSQVFYPGSASYYIMIATGPASSDGSSTTQHSESPQVSSSTVNLLDFTAYIQGSNTKRNLVKAHGVIMLFAWMVFASFGMLMPRYFKSEWPEKKWCGKQIWFQLHQPCMIITFFMTAIAFILIFVKVQGYSSLDSPGVAHPPLGIIVMILVTLNPIMAAFRPDPAAERRKIFNICHFVVGLLAQLCSVIVIFLSTYMVEAFSSGNQWSRWVMVAYICWHAIFEISFAIDMHFFSKKDKNAPLSTSVPMNGYSKGTDPDTKLDEKSSSAEKDFGLKTVALIVYGIGVFGLAVAMSVGVGLS